MAVLIFFFFCWLQDERDKLFSLLLSVGDMSIGRQEAFEIFRRDYEHNDSIEDNKQELKERYAEAKSRGEIVNKSRAKISELRLIKRQECEQVQG